MLLPRTRPCLGELFSKPLSRRRWGAIFQILLKLTAVTVDGILIPMQGAIFPSPLSIGHDLLQGMLRFLSGMSDFARVNAHQPRWGSLPGIRESDKKVCCLYCWKRDKLRIRDSEWHSVVDASP